MAQHVRACFPNGAFSLPSRVSSPLCEPLLMRACACVGGRVLPPSSRVQRLLADELDDPDRVMAQLRVLEVPTFIFYRGAREVRQHLLREWGVGRGWVRGPDHRFVVARGGREAGLAMLKWDRRAEGKKARGPFEGDLRPDLCFCASRCP